MDLTRKRHIASWLLLAVFVPMMVIATLHQHQPAASAQVECMECVQHHCHGHLAPLAPTSHDCVLCQFLSLTFVAAAIAAVVLFCTEIPILFQLPHSVVKLDACGIPSLRAPPHAIYH